MVSKAFVFYHVQKFGAYRLDNSQKQEIEINIGVM